ncbi:MAG: 3-oxoacyl-[acyl-carrier-protein] synthase III C-terminal domain-containing protein [Patescibacteria group bacterium]|nr:3-oxoacyl-[acyl-carrier-protein] synthase III C-terminal domain-containing protein [Patescibacteria group bacterium]
MPKHVRKFLDDIEMEPEEYSSLILHQANAFMLRRLAKKIGFELEKISFSIQEYGNTSSVSIPLTICSQNEKFKFTGLNLLLGMGAGLSTGIVSINLSALQCSKVFLMDL